MKHMVIEAKTVAKPAEMPAAIAAIFDIMRPIGCGTPHSLAWATARQPLYFRLSEKQFDDLRSWLADHAPEVNLANIGYYDKSGRGILPADAPAAKSVLASAGVEAPLHG